MLSPDGRLAIQQASRAESAAFREYQRVLSIFADLTIHGKMPPED
jgi:hypothetical protein